MSRTVKLTVVCLVLVSVAGSLGVAAILVVRKPAGARGQSARGGGPGFDEMAAEAGITFRAHFLPGEQGEKFKINLYDHGSGVAVADFDGDGFEDIYLVNQLGPNALYRNRGDGTFIDVTQQAGVGLGDRICTAATFADYDNDGRPDLYVTSTRGGNVLFRNQGDGTFKDVTRAAGLEHVGHSQAAFFFDYDNDGFLDLLVINTAKWTTERYDRAGRHYEGKGDGGGLLKVIGSPKEYNILYHNNGDGTFTDVTAKSGLRGRGWASDVAVFDYNEDGYLDVLVTSMFGRSQLYRNNGNGTFTDVTLDTLGATPFGGTGVKAFDFNNDGKLDLYIVDMHSDMWMGLDERQESLPLARKYEKRKFRSWAGPNSPLAPTPEEKYFLNWRLGVEENEILFGNALYRNRGNGKFEEVSDRANLETLWPWGIATGDFNNDGYEDVFITAGMGYPFYYWPNSLMMNNGDGTFTDRAGPYGIEPPPRGIYQDEKIGGKPAARSSRSAAVADFDGDGRLDLIVNNFNDRPYYFKNALPRQNYLALRLRGTKSNRDAIGAVVRVYAGKQILTRQVNPAGGYLAQSSQTLHFGLGDRDKIDRVEVRWPSGIRQVIRDPEINRSQLLTEPREQSAERGPAGRPARS